MDQEFYFVYFNVNTKSSSIRRALSLKRQALIRKHLLQWQKSMNDRYAKRNYTVISWQVISENEYTLYKKEIGSGHELYDMFKGKNKL